MIFSIKNLIKNKATVLFIFLSLFFSASAQAADVVFNNLSQYNSVQTVVGGITNWILGITAGITILFLIIGGIYYITAAGDDKQMEEGRKIINYAVIGLIFILIAYSLVKTLSEIIFG